MHEHINAANMHLKMQYTQQDGLQDPLVLAVELEWDSTTTNKVRSH